MLSLEKVEIMKMLTRLAVRACIVSALTAYSGSALALPVCSGTSLKADALTSAPDLIISNVPTCDGSVFVSGFQIIGGGGVEWYADAQHEGTCFNVDVTFLPDGVSAYDMDAVLDYLGDRDVDVFTLVKGTICPK